MLSRVTFALLALWAPGLRAADVNSVLQEARAAEVRFDTQAALVLFRQADSLRPNDAAILQAISKQYSDAMLDTVEAAEKQHLGTESLVYARRSVALAPHNAVNVLALAICYGKLTAFADTRTKITYSRFVKQYADEALALDPRYALAHLVLGRWNYEVSSLGFGTRWLVRLVYGGLPDASTAEAVRQLRIAVALAPNRPAHHVELGLALLADGQRDAARATLTHALTLPKTEKYDAEAFARARAALK